jgi:metal-responsive CopG/Arc/MetJ family transcriptional regulator
MNLSKIVVYLEQDLLDKLTFKLYKLHEESGVKITRSALIRALIETYVNSDIETEVEEEIIPERFDALLAHLSEVNNMRGERMVTLHDCGDNCCGKGSS